MGKGNGKNFKL